MFRDLKESDIQPLNISSDFINEIEIEENLQYDIKDLFISNDEKDVRIMKYTSSVAIDQNRIVFPNQYFLFAAMCYDFAKELIKYCIFFDEHIRPSQSLKDALTQKKYTDEFNNLFNNESDREYFKQFLDSEDFRPGKKFFNGDKVRGTKDIFGSCILKKLNVPDSSSNYLGNIVYYLAQNDTLYQKIRAELLKTEIVQSSKAADFLRKVLTNTLILDKDFSAIHDFDNNSKEFLKLNGFNVGRNSNNLPTRNSDYDSTILWSYNGVTYYANLEITPNAMETLFFPAYNHAYNHIFSLAKENNQYVMWKFKNTREKKSHSPVQIIYYGVPGCGKSHQIQEDLKAKGITEENHQQKRVVFHPDYCNADFVGQILPITKKDGGIRYQFKAGPFTKILRDAYENPGKEYALIIEEINRGNAAAIFGDLFQLLDRKRNNDPIEKVNGNSYGPGWSDYCIENDYINAYFRGAYDSEEIPVPLPPKTLGNITFNDNVDIRLPPNLSLYATMNTSDQNVFTLDNAFQRRWEMKLISNDLENDEAHPDEKAQYNQEIGDTGVKWGAFRDEINKIIMQSAEENGLSSMEDKRLGGWFITPKKNPEAGENAQPVITKKAFAEKVLKYLWDDAFKFDRKSQFDNSYKTLENLIKAFEEKDFQVFQDPTIKGLNNQAPADATATTES